MNDQRPEDNRDIKAISKDWLKEIGEKYKDKLPTDSLVEVVSAISKTGSTLKISSVKTMVVKMSKAAYDLDREIFPVAKIPKDQLKPYTGNTFPAIFKEGTELFTYKMGDVTFYLPKKIVDGIMPSLESMHDIYLQNLQMAYEQMDNQIKFTLGEKLKRMGVDKKSMDQTEPYKWLERTEIALASMVLDIHRSDGSRMIGALCSLCLPPDQGNEGRKGKGRVFEVTINEVFAPGMNFKTGEVEGQFIKMPLLPRTMLTYEKSLRYKLTSFIGMPKFEFYGNTLLEWSGLTATLLKRKDMRNKIYLLALKILKEMGFERVKVDYCDSPKDFRKWKFTYQSLQKKKDDSKVFVPMDATAEAFIDKFAEWSVREVHYGKKGRKLTEDEIRAMITNTIKAYGLDKCRDIFNTVNRMEDPSPKAFWNEIKRIKKAKSAMSDKGYSHV